MSTGEKFPSFCFLDKVFVSPYFLKDNFTKYRILGGFYFCLSVIYISLHTLACLVSDEKSNTILIILSIVNVIFLLTSFQDLPFVFGFP